MGLSTGTTGYIVCDFCHDAHEWFRELSTPAHLSAKARAEERGWWVSDLGTKYMCAECQERVK